MAARGRIEVEEQPQGPEITYVHHFLDGVLARQVESELRSDIEWEQHRIRLFGKMVDCPRLSAWYGDPGKTYGYSGVSHEPKPWVPILRDLKGRIEEAARTAFNSVLLNRYRDGSDSMGWHSDDEPELGPNPVIASLSLGARRKFRFRNRADHSKTTDVWLDHGSLLIMRGGVQAAWHHAIPKTKRIETERINLTFRWVLPQQ